MLRFTVAPALALLALIACDDRYYAGGQNEIVFGIQQSSTGVATGYELINLANRGGSVATAFKDGDGGGRCWFERLDERLGRPHLEGGVASWSGGMLPNGGLTVLANQPELTKQPGKGWNSTDTLSFYAEGFAMPPLTRVTMSAPLVELAIDSITPAPDGETNTIAIAPGAGLAVKWTPPVEQTRSRVMVTLTTERAEVRCFDDAETGSAIIGHSFIGKLIAAAGSGSADAGAPLTGKMLIASHRQHTMFADGGWIVYVVATHVHRDIAFTGMR